MIKKGVYKTNSPEETFSLGKKIAKLLKGGEVFAISGDLGAGKTSLVQGMAAGLNIKQTVNSPTFNIMKVYFVKQKEILQFCHIDAYRMTNGQELLTIGAGDYLGKKGIVSAIEWAKKVEDILPKSTIFIEISESQPQKRQIIIN